MSTTTPHDSATAAAAHSESQIQAEPPAVTFHRGARPLLSMSIDLDNAWSYMKTHGDEGWDQYPSYLDPVSDLVLEATDKHDLDITVFVVGQDAARPENHDAIKRLSDAGHEIGNHSFNHEPWLHLYTFEQLQQEFINAEQAIESVTGQRPRGFRGPGFSLSKNTLRVLVERGYRYDCSMFPTFIGPLARAYYFWTSRNLSAEEREDRKKLFGTFEEGFRPLKPYSWDVDGTQLPEIPVTTMPISRGPFHLSYLLYLAGYSPVIAKTYLRLSLSMCRMTGVEPSFLLHPLDFIGGDRESRLNFFPAMQLDTAFKMRFFDEVVEIMKKHFEIVPMEKHLQALTADGESPLRVKPIAPLA